MGIAAENLSSALLEPEQKWNEPRVILCSRCGGLSASLTRTMFAKLVL
jgi:hypothetical protein